MQPCHAASSPLWALEEDSYLNGIFMLDDCVGKRLALEVVLRYGPCKLVIAPTFWSKILLVWHLGILWSFGGRLGLLQVHELKGVANIEKIMDLNIVRESGSEVWQEKLGLAVVSDQTNWLEIVELFRLNFWMWKLATNWVLVTLSGY